MSEGSALAALISRAAALGFRRQQGSPARARVEAARALQSMLGPARHRVLTKARNRARNKVARRSRRINRVRAR